MELTSYADRIENAAFNVIRDGQVGVRDYPPVIELCFSICVSYVEKKTQKEWVYFGTQKNSSTHLSMVEKKEQLFSSRLLILLGVE